jgi:hypothetical protein
VFFRRKVDEGRVAAKTGKNTGICYFEFGVADDEDPYDLEVLRRRMPAYGVLVHDEYIESEQRKPEPLYRRNVGGQWVDNAEGLIPADWWNAVSQPGQDFASDQYAIDGLQDRSSSAVCKADRSGNLRLVAQRKGTGWLVEAFLKEMPSGKIRVARNGPLAPVGEDLERAGLTVEWADSHEEKSACLRFYDHVADQKMTVRRDERFDKAVESAVRRHDGDMWKWNRDAPGADVLMAASLAYNAALDSELVPFFV